MDKKISFIGMGFVGKAMYHAFCSHFDVKIYDKYQEGYDTLEEAVNHSDVMFVCVPTPMNDDGSQDLSNVKDVIESIERARHGIDLKHVVIKTTVVPGTCRNIAWEHRSLNIVMNPEFLTERVAVLDVLNQTRIVLGGKDLSRVEEIYSHRFPHTPIFKCSWEEAELVKYVNNCFFALKISFMNEIYEMCSKLNLDYEKIKQMFLADGRVANSHVEVPFQGDPGFGGKCFPKDANALVKYYEKLGLSLDTIKSALKVNDRVRKNRDWETIVGATSKCDYGKEEV